MNTVCGGGSENRNPATKSLSVKDVTGCNWQMCCNICIVWWFRLKKATVCVQEKQKAVQIV